MLGPMVNPSFPKHQMVGVFNLELLRLYNYLYQQTDKNYSIVHDLGEYDELSLTNNAKIASKPLRIDVSPNSLGLKNITLTLFLGETTLKKQLKSLKQLFLVMAQKHKIMWFALMQD